MANDDSPKEWARKREEQFAATAAKETSMRDRVLQQLYGGLWHTTHPERFKGILESGAISPEPNIPDSKRWCTGGGAEHYPFTRSLGGVSLFDFERFDPDGYSRRCPASCWAYFVPYHSAWRRAVWIEIDRTQVEAPFFMSGHELLAKWKADGAFGRNIMPEIEAAFLGPLSQAAFKRAFLVCEENTELRELSF